MAANSTMEPRRGLSGTWLIVMVVLVDATSACWFGYDQGVFAGVLVSSDFLYQFPSTLNANISGIVSSCFFLGAFLGALLACTIGDRLGRKRTIVLGHVLNLAGALLQVVAWQLPQMVVGRLVNGVGIGLTSSICPVFLSECAPARLRGKLVTVGTSCNVLAFCLSQWISYALFFRPGAIQWRLPLAVQLLFPVIILPTLLLVPESPRWLLLAGREAEAKRVIARLAGPGVGTENPGVLAEFHSIRGAIRLERKNKVGAADVLRCRDRTQNLRRLVLSCGSQFIQQFAGINALGFYLPTLLQENVGYDQEMARLMAAVSGTVYATCAFGSLLIIDRLGRRNSMLFGVMCCGACLLIASLCLKASNEDPARRQRFGKVATAMFVIYHLFFGSTMGSTPWVYSAEVNSLGWRTRGAAVATATNWLGGFVVVQFTKAGVDNLGWALYLMFAVFCFAFAPVIFCFYPETARRTLEDMDQMFLSHPGVFVVGKRDMVSRKRPQALVDAEMARIAEAAAQSDQELTSGDEGPKSAGVVQVVVEVPRDTEVKMA